MEQEIDIFEEIRSYILGKMTSEEAVAFEERMAKDENLRREYENIREVGHAVTKMHSIEAIRESIEKNAQTEPAVNSNLEEDLEELEKELAILEGKDSPKRVSVWDTIVAWFTPEGTTSEGGTIAFRYTYVSRLVVSLAVAASVAVAVIVPVNHHHLSTLGYKYAPEFLEIQTYRSDSDEMMEEAMTSYNKGDYRDAEAKFEQVIGNLENKIDQLGDSDSDVLSKMTLTAEKDEAEWYCALTYMKNREVRKAKQLLKAIANNANSPYHDEASKILEDVY